MLLVLDVSNRFTAVAVYRGDRSRSWRIASDTQRSADELSLVLDALLRRAGIEPRDLVGAVIGSVVPALTATVASACVRAFDLSPLVVGPGVRTGVRLRIDNPREVGADRIANVVAARRRYGAPAVVVDFGTATTFDAISPEGDYLGSVIAPGVDMAVAALAHQTAQLREVELVQPAAVIGTSTAAAVQSGIVFGFAGLVDSIVARMAAEIGQPVRAIATGPHADLVGAVASSLDVVDPALTVDGLRLIWELNAGGGAGGR